MTYRVLVLGATGMLGVQVARQLKNRGFSVVSSTRREHPGDGEIRFDVDSDEIEDLIAGQGPFDYVINCIGIIKPYIHDGNPEEELRAVLVNSVFPQKLAQAARNNGARVIQIATDCTFSGSASLYHEDSPHDALDVYGKTKSLGEVASSNVMHIRCSIIGREYGRSTSLVEWVLAHEHGESISGYTNHLWNGVTTNVFGRVCAGILAKDLFSAGKFHLVPSTIATKYELVQSIASACGRDDLTIQETEAPVAVDRTLSTIYPELNQSLWRAAGFETVPSVERVVATLSEG